MIFKKFSEKKWYNGAVIVCIGVVLYVMLTHLDIVLSVLRRFIGYFKPIILGAVIAYIMSPLANFFYYRVFKHMRIKTGQLRWYLSVIVAVAIMLVSLFLLIGMLVPQLLQSLTLFSNNIDYYAVSLMDLLDGSPLEMIIDHETMETFYANAMDSITSFVKQNAGSILGVAKSSGKNILTAMISLILAVYLLIDKKRVLIGMRHFLELLLPPGLYEDCLDFILRCDSIMGNYVVQTLIDAVIVGAANAIFMAICRMPYIGLISVVVAVTNLIPNFGPIIGGVIGAFILVLVNPMQAVMFIIFTCCLQLIDGYVLKPKLFSSSLGVSGLLILTSTIVLGNMFGIIGILLSIPAAAVCSFVFYDYLIPWQTERKRLHSLAAAEENAREKTQEAGENKDRD